MSDMSGTFEATGFTPGFAARHNAAAAALVQAFPTPVFAAVDLRERVAPAPVSPRSFSPQPVGPKHFSPAEPGHRATEGWDLLDPEVIVAEPNDGIDRLLVAHSAGYAEGFAAAEAEAAAAREADLRDQMLVDGLALQIGSGSAIDRAAVADHLRQTVLALVAKLVGEVGIAPDVLAGRIESATKLLADTAEAALLRVHPDDVPLLEGRLPKTVFAAGDPSVSRGSFVLESASTLVEDGPDHWLEQLSQAIEIVPVPTC
jgi:flagellar assembly protein FliH